jgi:hypothetical protein
MTARTAKCSASHQIFAEGGKSNGLAQYALAQVVEFTGRTLWDRNGPKNLADLHRVSLETEFTDADKITGFGFRPGLKCDSHI